MFDENDDGFPVPRLRDQPERTPRMIEQIALAVTPESSLDETIAALDAAEWLAARAKMIQMIAKSAAIAWIDRNGEFDVGDMHYSVGHYTVTKCMDVPACGIALLDTLKGDFDRFLRLLSSDAYKYGAVKAVLDRTTYGQHFRVRPAARLINGIPERVLKRSDPSFIRRSPTFGKES